MKAIEKKESLHYGWCTVYGKTQLKKIQRYHGQWSQNISSAWSSSSLHSMKKMKISSRGPRCFVRLEETAVEPAHKPVGIASDVCPIRTNLNMRCNAIVKLNSVMTSQTTLTSILYVLPWDCCLMYTKCSCKSAHLTLVIWIGQQ